MTVIPAGDVERFVDQLLSQGDPRSVQYRAGVLAVVRMRVENVPIPHYEHAMGTVEADAFYAGVDRGHYEWRKLMEPSR